MDRKTQLQSTGNQKAVRHGAIAMKNELRTEKASKKHELLLENDSDKGCHGTGDNYVVEETVGHICSGSCLRYVVRSRGYSNADDNDETLHHIF